MIDAKVLRPLSIPSIMIGIGMGGFVDGILFHQILQVHNMLSNRYYPDTLAKEQLNMVWDGLFHAFTWTVTAFGIAFLWRAARKSEVPLITEFFVGSVLLGWGLFNLIEGLIDHEILGVHHVVQRAEGSAMIFWDVLFLLFGVVLIGIGAWARRRARQSAVV